MPPAAELPDFLHEILQTFQGGEMDDQGEDPLGGHATKGLGAFLIASSRTSTQVQYLRAEVSKLRELSALQAKKFTQRESSLHQELADLRQSRKETKRLLFEKVIELKEKAKEVQAKMARLEEMATQQEVRLGQLEGELVRKDELFSEMKEGLTIDATRAYGAGFEDAMAQVACVHPGWTYLKPV